MTANLPANISLDVSALRDEGYWWCGRCSSVIPVTFWHRCDSDGTHSGPHEPLPLQAGQRRQP